MYDMKTPRRDYMMYSFIGACYFYRRHIKNFTYTSAILTDLIKKSTTWRWGPQEQQALDELKDNVANDKCVGVPTAHGKIILVTDASNVLANANCTLFCAPNAQKRTGSQRGKKKFFWMFDERDFGRSEKSCFFSVVQLRVPQCDVFYISLAF